MSFQDKSTQKPESQSIEKTLVCRHCDDPAERLVEKSKRDLVRCPRCGIVSDYEEAVQRAKGYFQRSFVHGKINDFMGRMAADTKHLKNVVYTPGKLPAISSPDFIFR